MALRSGYMHVERTEQILFENAGDLTVAVDNIVWMNDCTVKPRLGRYVSVRS